MCWQIETKYLRTTLALMDSQLAGLPNYQDKGCCTVCDGLPKEVLETPPSKSKGSQLRSAPGEQYVVYDVRCWARDIIQSPSRPFGTYFTVAQFLDEDTIQMLVRVAHKFKSIDAWRENVKWRYMDGYGESLWEAMAGFLVTAAEKHKKDLEVVREEKRKKKEKEDEQRQGRDEQVRVAEGRETASNERTGGQRQGGGSDDVEMAVQVAGQGQQDGTEGSVAATGSVGKRRGRPKGSKNKKRGGEESASSGKSDLIPLTEVSNAVQPRAAPAKRRAVNTAIPSASTKRPRKHTVSAGQVLPDTMTPHLTTADVSQAPDFTSNTTNSNSREERSHRSSPSASSHSASYQDSHRQDFTPHSGPSSHISVNCRVAYITQYQTPPPASSPHAYSLHTASTYQSHPPPHTPYSPMQTPSTSAPGTYIPHAHPDPPRNHAHPFYGSTPTFAHDPRYRSIAYGTPSHHAPPPNFIHGDQYHLPPPTPPHPSSIAYWASQSTSPMALPPMNSQQHIPTSNTSFASGSGMQLDGGPGINWFQTGYNGYSRS